MRTIIIGAGPTGLYTSIALARRGHDVTVVDRDHGPDADGSWDRKGVMQFHHPHGFRKQVVDALLAEMPDVWVTLVEAGAVPSTVPHEPDLIAGVRVRRLTFERVLRAAARCEPRVRIQVGHADEIVGDDTRVLGVRVDGELVEADLVIDASGRSGRLGDRFRAAGEGGETGISYVSRQYELLPGAEPGPVNSPIGAMALYPGYQAMVFTQDNGTFSTLVVRASADDDLSRLREQDAFDAAARAIPLLAAWTDSTRARPITPVLPGGRLFNTYRGQLTEAGEVALPGLMFLGDAVCTTNPAAGRGVAISMIQAQELLRLLDEHGRDFVTVSTTFDQWCVDNVKPWFDDHVYWDADQVRRWAGGDVDLTRRLPSDLVIVAAMEADLSLMRFVGPYLGMQAPPGILDAAQPIAQEIYARGWRPAAPVGPTRDELADLVKLAVRGPVLAAC
jgi:2-polyprenyl-6-methoxyphenol hydroxylase-like FAD-dependent oxidoreductase